MGTYRYIDTAGENGYLYDTAGEMGIYRYSRGDISRYLYIDTAGEIRSQTAEMGLR